MLFSRTDNLPALPGSTIHQPLLAAAMGLILALPALLVDVPIAEYCLVHGVPGELRRVLEWSEVVAHGSGVAIVAIILLVLDPTNRRRIPRLLIAAYAAGLAADLFKLLIARTRPRHFDFNLGVLDTFAGWFPLLGSSDGISKLDSRYQSFPSAHTAVAVALAFGLARLYPRGRTLFFVLAGLAAAQRIDAGAHYLSDTFFGMSVGAFIFICCNRSPVLNRHLARLEQPPAGPVLAGQQ